MRLEKIRGAIEVAVLHSEWLEDVLIDVDHEVIASEPLNDLPEKDVTEIGVAPASAWSEGDVRIWEHGSDLRPLCRFKRLPGAV